MPRTGPFNLTINEQPFDDRSSGPSFLPAPGLSRNTSRKQIVLDYEKDSIRTDGGSKTRMSVTTLRFTTAIVAAGIAGGGYAIAASSTGDAAKPSYSKSEVFFELNHTDGDLGIHARVDGDGWRRLFIDGPDGCRMLDVQVKGRLKMQGLTELFTESAEPTFDELPPKEFFSRFPEGEYVFLGTTIDGKKLSGKAMLSHVMPAPPSNLKVSGHTFPKDCDEGPIPMASKPVMITWDSVTKSHPKIGKAGTVKVVKYEMVVEREEPTKLVLNVDLPPTAKSFQVPASFVSMDDGSGFKFEIVVREESGNQTVFESCFKVAQ